MTAADTAAWVDALDLLMLLSPADQLAEAVADVPELGHHRVATAAWVADRYDAAIVTTSGQILAAAGRPDELVVTLLTSNGVTVAELTFAAPDGMVYPANEAAFRAVLATWSAL